MKNRNCVKLKLSNRFSSAQAFKILTFLILIFCSRTAWGETPPAIGTSANAPTNLNPTAQTVITTETNQISSDLYQAPAQSDQANAILGTHLGKFCSPADTVPAATIKTFSGTATTCSGSQNAQSYLANADLRLSNLLAQFYIQQSSEGNSFYNAALSFFTNLIQPFPINTQGISSGVANFFANLTTNPNTTPTNFVQNVFTPEAVFSVARYPFLDMLAKRSTPMPSFSNADLTNTKWTPGSILEEMEKYSYLWFQNQDWVSNMQQAYQSITTTSSQTTNIFGQTTTTVSPRDTQKNPYTSADYTAMAAVSFAQISAYNAYVNQQIYRQFEINNALLGVIASLLANQTRLATGVMGSIPSPTTLQAPPPSANTPPAVPSGAPASTSSPATNNPLDPNNPNSPFNPKNPLYQKSTNAPNQNTQNPPATQTP